MGNPRKTGFYKVQLLQAKPHSDRPTAFEQEIIRLNSRNHIIAMTGIDEAGNRSLKQKDRNLIQASWCMWHKLSRDQSSRIDRSRELLAGEQYLIQETVALKHRNRSVLWQFGYAATKDQGKTTKERNSHIAIAKLEWPWPYI